MMRDEVEVEGEIGLEAGREEELVGEEAGCCFRMREGEGDLGG